MDYVESPTTVLRHGGRSLNSFCFSESRTRKTVCVSPFRLPRAILQSLLRQGSDKIRMASSICVGQEHTYRTLENILDEIMGVFPSQYIHLGTDECWRGNWEHCTHCRAKMQELGVDDTLPLHGYFVERMSDYLQSKGRTAAGWDEIFETGSKPGILGMFWRGHSPEAVRMRL